MRASFVARGFVEFKKGTEWQPAVRIDAFLNGENQRAEANLFSRLFGVGGEFRAVAPSRGIPLDASFLSAGVFDKSQKALFPTWITLFEIEATEYEGFSLDPFPHSYHKRTGKEVEAELSLSALEKKLLLELGVLDRGELVLRTERVRKKDILTKGFVTLVGIMHLLSKSYGGDDSVRIVVWFEQSERRGIAEEQKTPTNSKSAYSHS